MSYRAFKRLLGETSLERKCRFLFGGFILLLITGSFWLYAGRTEHWAYEQITTTCRVLVNHIVTSQIATNCRQGDTDREDKQRILAMNEFRQHSEELWPEGLNKYEFRFIKPNATRTENRADDEFAVEKLKEFQNDREKMEDNQLLPALGKNFYYSAIRARSSCLACHREKNPDLAENDLIAVVKVNVPTRSIEKGIHRNRAILISTALGTALLIMGGSYLIVRYVIVKPVKHLKEVSDAISSGELNVRSEIQTGDEFEDLSHAFNRMLRNLVAMQDRLRKVNADLDRKVDELAHANLALYESYRLKSDFLATMSHELRTPLNSILGFSNVLLESPLTEKQQRWVTNIQSSGQQLLNLIDDILDLAKIEAGKMEVKLSEFSCFEICEGLLSMFRPMAEKKNIDLRAQYEPGIPLLRQDVGKFQQILSNLLSNAIKFTPEGGRVMLRASVVAPAVAAFRPASPLADLDLGAAASEA